MGCVALLTALRAAGYSRKMKPEREKTASPRRALPGSIVDGVEYLSHRLVPIDCSWDYPR